MNRPQFFKVRKPQDPAEQFAGKTLTAYPTAKDVLHRTNGERLVVREIAGNLTHQTMFQINGTHLVSMLDAYSEINRADLPNQELHEAFLSTVAEEVIPDKAPSLIDRTPTYGKS